MDTIVMTVCARPNLLERVLGAWSRVRGVHDWRFLFMVEPTPKLDEALALIEAFEHKNKFVMKNSRRLGVLENPFQGLDLACASGNGIGNDFVVLAEEDLIPAQSALEFFSFARDQFRSVPDIMAVCAHGEGSMPYQVVARDKFAVWLWGTWQDRWYKYLRDTWDHDYSHRGWDWNIKDNVLPDNKLKCVFPEGTLVDHIGIFGMHMTPDIFLATRPKGFVEELPESRFVWIAGG